MHSIFRRKISENNMLAVQKFTAILILALSKISGHIIKHTSIEHLAIGDYENWEEEKWVNVADKDWQEFMDTLAGKLKKKGVDGFFIDNCDVYDYAHKKDIFDGLTVILKKIRAMGKPVVVNGGDIYVTAYQSRYGSAADIMTGVNQESVWSRIDFTTKTFHTQKKTEREYFCQYLQACKADGMDVYLLEYTTDHKLIRRIKKYCRKKKYDYYIAEYRYDTQLLIDRRDRDLDEDEIADYITENFEGNSLIAAGDEDLVKIHFHTNEPWKILEYCNTVGEIYDIVVEDMIRQAAGQQG